MSTSRGRALFEAKLPDPHRRTWLVVDGRLVRTFEGTRRAGGKGHGYWKTPGRKPVRHRRHVGAKGIRTFG